MKEIKIIDFYAKWCGPCKRVSPIMDELTEEGYQVQKIDIENEYELAEKYKIRNIPTVIITKDDEEIDRIIGYNNKEVYINKLKELI